MKKIDIQRLADFLSVNYPEIQIAYLFGSSKDGVIAVDSDVDVAIYLEEGTSPFSQLNIAAALEDELESPVDVVVLNKANPVLAHEVLRNGFRLFARDEIFRAQMELRIFREYLDNFYYLKRRYG